MNIFDAIKDNDLEKVKELLDSGIDVNVKNEAGNTPLLFSVLNSSYIGIVKLLLEHPEIDVNAKNEYNEISSLFLAFEMEDTDTFKLLLSHPKIDVNIIDYREQTILYYACRYNRIELVKLLLEKPNLNVNVDECLIALSYNGQLEIIKLLLKHPNINVNVGSSNSSPLYYAIFKTKSKSNDILKLLVSHPKIDINKGELFNGLILLLANAYSNSTDDYYYNLYIEKVKIMMNNPNLKCGIYSFLYLFKNNIELTHLLKKRFPNAPNLKKIKINTILDSIED